MRAEDICRKERRRMNLYNIKELMLKRISKSDFLKSNDIAEENISSEFFARLTRAYIQKSANEVDEMIYLLFSFGVIDEKFVDLLDDLLICDWHWQHENIAMLLQKLKSTKSIDALFETSQKAFPYLSYDDSYALAVKCIWALGDIGTDLALEKLEVLTQSENPIIKKNAIKQVSRYK